MVLLLKVVAVGKVGMDLIVVVLDVVDMLEECSTIVGPGVVDSSALIPVVVTSKDVTSGVLVLFSLSVTIMSVDGVCVEVVVGGAVHAVNFRNILSDLPPFRREYHRRTRLRMDLFTYEHSAPSETCAKKDELPRLTHSALPTNVTVTSPSSSI
jgi:hypothetical protein